MFGAGCTANVQDTVQTGLSQPTGLSPTSDAGILTENERIPGLLTNSLDIDLPLVRYLTIHDVQCNSRKKALLALREGQILLNGRQCTNPAQLVAPEDEVQNGGRVVVPFVRHRHVLLHKPAGYLSARSNYRQVDCTTRTLDERPSVYSLIDPASQARHCAAVGRLDVDTTGALLFSTDGLLANRLLHPQHHVRKLYRAQLRTAEPLSSANIERISAGVRLGGCRGELVRGHVVNVNEEGLVNIELDCGQFHVVKRIFSTVGRPIATLHRLAFAGLTLGGLSSGRCRELTDDEAKSLYSLAAR